MNISKPGLYGEKGNMITPWNILMLLQKVKTKNNILTEININNSNAILIIPEEIKSIEEYATLGIEINTIYINKNIEHIKDSTFDGTFIKKIEVDPNNLNYSSENGVLFSKDKSILIHCPSEKEGKIYKIPDFVKNIKPHAFISNNTIEELEIPGSIKNINDLAFQRMQKLKKIKFSEGVEIIQSKAMAQCKILSEVKLPNSLKFMADDTFFNCFGLERLMFDTLLLDYNGTLEQFKKVINIEKLIKVSKMPSIQYIVKENYYTLDNLIKEGYSFRNANKILKEQEER